MTKQLLPYLGSFCRSCAAVVGLSSILCLSGCASNGSAHSIQSQIEDTGNKYLHFSLKINSNGTLDSNGYGVYAILLNSKSEPIDVTNNNTFTDIIRFDGVHCEWYTRQANTPEYSWDYYLVGSLDEYTFISSDATELDIVLDIADSTNFINQYIKGESFTAHALTTDSYKTAILGRALDTMGPGLDGNSLYTISASKIYGAISPLPTSYPSDDLYDWKTHDDLAPGYPYENFDIASFQIYNNDQE